MIILHGENTLASRSRLTALIDQAKGSQKEVVRSEAKELDIPKLEILLGSDSLFGTTRLVIVDGLLSLPPSKKKDQLIERLIILGGTNSDLILWEPKNSHAATLKKFSQASIEIFKPTKTLFRWLDSLAGNLKPEHKKIPLKLLNETLAQDDPFLVFTLLIRQVRLLIQAKEGSTPTGAAPFMIGKLRHQASTFSLDQLLSIHHQLLSLDLSQKTSSPGLPLEEELALLVAKM